MSTVAVKEPNADSALSMCVDNKDAVPGRKNSKSKGPDMKAGKGVLQEEQRDWEEGAE